MSPQLPPSRIDDEVSHLIAGAHDIWLEHTKQDPENPTEAMLVVIARCQLALAYAELAKLGFETSADMDTALQRLCHCESLP